MQHQTRRRSLLAMAGVTSGLAALLAPSTANAAPPVEPAAPAVAPQPDKAVPDAALAAVICRSWTDFTTTPGVRYTVSIPSTTRNGSQSNCVLVNGISGDGVYKLQDALRRCYGQNIAKDGDYGTATEGAVRNVQRLHGIRVDGDYGPSTRSVMIWPKYLNGTFHHC